MKKWMAALLGCFFFAAVLAAGCGSDRVGVSDEAPTAFTEPQYEWGKSGGENLVVWSMEPDLQRTYMQRAFLRYQELTGNELTLVQMPKWQFEEKMQAAFHGGGERPDIVLSYGGINIQPYDPDENFYDFTEARWVDDLTATSINQTIYNGKVIGLPHWESSITGMLYNKRIFEAYGIQVPKNQNEFLIVCEKLLENGVIPMYLPAKDCSMLLYQIPLDTLVQDSRRLADLNNGRLHYADMPEMRVIVEWYRMMAEKGYLGAHYQQDSWDGMNEALQSGKYAMMLCWDTWLYTDFSGDPADFGLMPAFVGVPDTGAFEGPNLALLMVNKKSPRVQAAVDFITFMADPYNYNAAFQGIYTAPVFKNQIANISTPQYVASDRLIDRNYYGSRAWLRIEGFSQLDSACILKYMSGAPDYTAEDCLREMDTLRKKRAGT